MTGRGYSNSNHSDDSGRHEKSLLSMQNEPSIADVLAELRSQKDDIKEYVNNKVSSLRQEIQGANISVSTELKKFKGERDITWKSKGNKIQYNFNAEVLETLSSINWAIDNGKLDYAKELIQEISVKVKDRNKHIRIADSSSGGWETVNQYVSNPIASDSDDESKIHRAENRAIKKRKLSSKTGKDNREYGKNKASFTAPNPFSDFPSIPSTSYPGRPMPQQQFLQKQQLGTTPFRFGGCYVCGDFTHFQRECPLVARGRNSGQQDKKQSSV